MYHRLQLAIKYVQYFFSASSPKGHGIHSPFVFNFLTEVLNDQRQFYSYEQIEQQRKKLLNNPTILTVSDFGAGSGLHAFANQRSICSIASHAAKPKKWGQLLFRIANYYQPATMVELGTSLGISTAYLASGNTSGKVNTIEGSAEIAQVATQNFQQLSLSNITSITGRFDNVLPTLLDGINTIDLAFIDGNHRLQPTIDYFDQLLLKRGEQCIMVFDDIHWSKEMETAWETIKAHPEVMLTVDLFFIGIVFFNSSFKAKQHFTIRC
jgi:predicted O-methyltransferase YrrM